MSSDDLKKALQNDLGYSSEQADAAVVQTEAFLDRHHGIETLTKVYERALENIKFALNNSRADDEALHIIGNEVSWALSHKQYRTRESEHREEI